MKLGLAGVGIVVLLLDVGAVAGPIPWISGPAMISPAGKLVSSGHVVIQFAGNPSATERATLEAQGIVLLEYVGDHAWFARVGDGGKQLPDAASIVGVAVPRTDWKLHPGLLAGECPDHALLARPPADAAKNAAAEPWCAVYVQFHRDVDAGSVGRKLVCAHGGLVRASVRLVNTLVVEMPLAEVGRLAAEDAVQWLEPALPPFTSLNDSNRERVQANALQGPPYGLDGAGVTVMIYDSSVAGAGHSDFLGRVHVRDDGEPKLHATHVAGTLGGSGTRSPSHGGTANQWRGMAPAAIMESYAYESTGTEILLYSNPGDLEADYTDAILNHGAVLANNSLGSNITSNGLDCALLGDYGLTSRLIDAIVRGAVNGPFRSIWAGGNERSGIRCGTGYATIAPPAGAKNAIIVGAVNADDDSMTGFSGWGPTDDGRLKPDFCAPGSETVGDKGVTSTDTAQGYAVLRGTSMAAPTVTGLCALLLEDYRARYPGPDPRNATLKALLAHTAVDLGAPGPDYKFGYGSVRAKDAVDFMRTGRFVENSVEDGAMVVYVVEVAPGEGPLKATMVWDDGPAAPNVALVLVNDLDLVAVSPSNLVYFPWTLDPDNPADAAQRNGPDRVNNIEQVVVDASEPGTWELRVVGYSVPEEPQVFTLAVSSDVRPCSNAGTAAFQAPAYSCGSAAGIILNDCQLNGSPSARDTAPVRVFSTSDLAGQSVLLVETGPDTATFTGSVALEGPGGEEVPGAVRVTHGDTLSVEYSDADHGSGAPAIVRDDVTIDCRAPTIGTAGVANTAATATISLGFDEPARSTVSYGSVRGVWSGEEGETHYLTDPVLRLAGLTPETQYFFGVSATDLAGNMATADNHGAYFTFTTAFRPDFFTELFGDARAGAGGDFDLAHATLALTPDGSASGYAARFAGNVYVLPTDPDGGAILNLGDDDSDEVVVPPGKRIWLYGKSYGRFWVGSNGYLNIEGADTIQVPSLSHHFRAKRVSGLFADLDPSRATGSGDVSWKVLEDQMAVTWQNVPEWDHAERLNTFQIRMYFDGALGMSWLELGTTAGIAGISNGKGLSPDFIESDLSAYPRAALVLYPIGPKRVMEIQTLTFLVAADSNVTAPTLAADNLPGSATFVDHGDGTGSFLWDTQVGDKGVYPAVRYTASDTVATKEEVITITVEALNLPPSAAELTITPANPAPFDTLLASYTYHDPENQPEGPSEIRWYRNGLAVSSLNDLRSVPAHTAHGGQIWSFTVRPNDGVFFGDAAQSSAVTIRNPADLDQDAAVDALDVQRIINAVLGIAPQGNEDTNGDGSIDALDLQLVINAALGIASPGFDAPR